MEGFSSGNLGEVFDGNSRYAVLPHQRGYAWTVDEVEEFLDDLESAKDYDEHFFGFMLTISDPADPSKVIKVIDGQQRLSTTMLFLICARNHFKRVNTSAAQKYQEMLESRIHTSEYETKPIFTLGRTNQNLFKEILLRISIERRILDALATNDSNEMLIAAYKKIRARISGKDVESVQDDLNTLFTKFVIIRYDYPNEQKAYSLFHLINNRGIRLNESDHIKNYLFSELEKFQSSKALDEYDKIWTEMRENVMGKSKANYKTLDVFLHHYLLVTNAYKNFTNPKLKDMQRAFSSLINEDSKKRPHQIIDNLLYWSKTLNSLRAPKSANFDENTTIMYYLKKIKEANAVYAYPPILLAYDHYWKRGYKILFELVVMLCFKFYLRAKVISDISTSNYEHQMYTLTEGIRAKSASKLSQSITTLIEHEAYPSSDKVFDNLETMRITTGRIAVALLQEVEYAKTKIRRLDLATPEHIMPKKPGEWQDYIFEHNKKHRDKEKTPEENIRTIHKKYLGYLGNQTLLSRSNNKNASNSTFEKKKEDYEQHPTYQITKDLLDIPIWNVDAILERNRKFARILCNELDLDRIAKYLHKEYQDKVEPNKVL